MRFNMILVAVAAAAAAYVVPLPASAQWSSGTYTHYTKEKSSSGYVINGNAPGVSAVAPSNGLTHTFITEHYECALSANGVTYSTTIHHFYALYGSVSSGASCGSGYSCVCGQRGRSASLPSQNYDTGTLDYPSQSDYTIAAPSGTVWIEVTTDATGFSTASATASASGGFTYVH